MFFKKKGIARLPMARQTGLLVEQVDDELVIYDMDGKEAHCLRPLAAAVFHCSDGVTRTPEIAERVSKRLGGTVSVAQVEEAVEQLEQTRLLESPQLQIALDDGSAGISRRDAVRKFAYGGAVAAISAPLITSILSPGTAYALSGCPVGSACTKNTDCSSGHCCQTNAGKSCNSGCCVGGLNDCDCKNSKCVAQVVGLPNPTCTPCTALCIQPTGCAC